MKPDKDKTIRSFLAIEPNDSLKLHLSAATKNYQKQNWAESMHWSAHGNWHMTLKFLHQASVSQLEELIHQLEIQISEQHLFEDEIILKVTHTGLFPETKKPVALVAHVEINPKLKSLIHLIEETSLLCNFKPEIRPFKGHITLGRCPKEFKSVEKIESFSLNHDWKVKQFALFKSELTNEGPVYTRLKKFEIQDFNLKKYS